METIVEFVENGNLDFDKEAQLLREGCQRPIAVCCKRVQW